MQKATQTKPRSPVQEIPDPRRRSYVLPTRIVWQSAGRSAPRHSEAILQAGASQASVWSAPGCILRAQRQPSALVLDYGRELHGGVKIVHGGATGRKAKVRIRFGESVSEAMGAPDNDHAIHDTVVELAPMGSTEIGNTGFRFVRIDALESGGDVELKAVHAVSVMRALDYKGSFACSDPRLDEIWRVGAYTVHLNLQEHVWDGVKRDRLVWVGDLHPEAMVVNAVFGQLDVVERSLDLTRDETPLPGYMNGISSYSLWWILIHDCWYLHHGDLAYLRAQRSYLLRLLTQLSCCFGADGAECLPAHRFLDWPTQADPTAVHAGLHALLTLAFEAGGRLCAALQEPAAVRRCQRVLARLRRYRAPETASKQVNALSVLAGITDARTTNAHRLAIDPFRGISTFYGYYVLQARAKAGDIKGCLDLIRTYWGGMLDVGATTFWEHFEIDWLEDAGRIDEIVPRGRRDIHADCGDYCYKGLRHSLCHGWAGGPTAWLAEHVLGIRVMKPGARTIALRPCLGDLKWAKGSFPTPRGMLHVEHRRRADGRVHTVWDGPPGVKIVA